MDRKAALELGINTIVILVIAMVVIAAGIAFIRGFFAMGEEKLKEPFNLAEFGLKPSSSEPLVLQSGDITITSGKEKEIKAGYFNKENTPQAGVKIVMEKCTTSFVTQASGSAEVKPQMLSVAKSGDIQPGVPTDFRLLLTAKNAEGEKKALDTGTYICNLKAVDSSSITLAEIQMTMVVTR